MDRKIDQQMNTLREKNDYLIEENKRMKATLDTFHKKFKSQNKQLQMMNDTIDELKELISKEIVTTTDSAIINNSTNGISGDNNNDNMTTNNITNNSNVTLVNIGEENLQYIMDILKNDLKQIITDDPVKSLTNCMEKIYYDKKTPENHIMGYDKENNRLLIHRNGKWRSKEGSFIVKNIKPFFEMMENLFDVDFDKYKHLRPTFLLNPHIPVPMTQLKKNNIKKFNTDVVDLAKTHHV